MQIACQKCLHQTDICESLPHWAGFRYQHSAMRLSDFMLQDLYVRQALSLPPHSQELLWVTESHQILQKNTVGSQWTQAGKETMFPLESCKNLSVSALPSSLWSHWEINDK